jgi:uncharacterized protein DUF262
MTESFERPQDGNIATAIEEERRDVRYVVTDYVAELLISKFGRDEGVNGPFEIYVPEYQRKLSWSADQKSYFIESMLLRIPITPVFFYEVEGRLEIVDGSQRIRTLSAFARDEFALQNLEKLDMLNGLTFSELPAAVRRRFHNTPVRGFVLDQGTDETVRIDLFRRLNTSGRRLADAEVRKGAYRGPFLDLVVDSAGSQAFRAAAPRMGGVSDEDSERQELATRFYVYLEAYEDFRHEVRNFLDAHTRRLNASLSRDSINSMRNEFESVMRFVARSFDDGFYRRGSPNRVPRVRFEAIAIGSALALRQMPGLEAGDTSWVHGDEFEALTRTDASNSGPRLRGRVEYVRDQLLGRTGSAN